MAGDLSYPLSRFPVGAPADILVQRQPPPPTPPAVDAWPVGSIFISTVSTDPALLFGYGTWAAFGTGRVLIGYDAGDPDFNAAEKTGGAKSITIDDHASHTHDVTANVSTTITNFQNGTGAVIGAVGSVTGGTSTTTNESVTLTHKSGGASPIPTVPPYIVVYMFQRTA